MNQKAKLIVGALVILTIGFTGYGIGRSGNSSESGVSEVASTFITELAQQDVDATYKLTSKSLQARNDKKYIENIAKSLKSENPEIVKEEVFVGSGLTKGQAIYLGTVKNLPEKDGDTDGSVIIRLISEGGGWKVDSTQIYQIYASR